MTPRPLGTSLVACAFALLLLTGCGGKANIGPVAQSDPQPSEKTAAKPDHPSAEERSTPRGAVHANRLLRELLTRSEADGTGYRRDSFEIWVEQRGCDTREDVLREEDRSKPGSGCDLSRGLWRSAYDGKQVRDPSDLDIDHVVPLKQAYVSGAWRWNYATRRRFANDLGYSGSLRAVSAESNRSKGDSDPAEWLPPRDAFRCKYVGTWIAVKYRWKLAVDRDEKRVLQRLVVRCGPRADVPRPKRAAVDFKQTSSRPHPATKKVAGAPEKRYSTCAEAKAHGGGPYRRGRDPEYSWYRDADDDGIVCEP